MKNLLTTIFLPFLLSLLHTTTAAFNYVDTSAVATKTLARQFMDPQNLARTSLRMQPLVWDSKLEKYAQNYANKRKYDCDLVHSNGPYGENIFWGSGRGWRPAQAVAEWVGERSYYNYRWNSCVGGEECGHYTQVVWKSTRKIGCAMVNCVNGRGVFMTCNYNPPGNYYGERPY